MKTNEENGARVLILGGKPIGSCELVNFAKSRGAFVIVTDYLSVEESPAKKIADEHWEISTADIDALEKLCRVHCVSAVMTGVHEFNIRKAIELCKRLGLTFYCTESQWDICSNKGTFKRLCIHNGISVAKEYPSNNLESFSCNDFPLMVKPLDGSGSRGISKCENIDQLLKGITDARKYSQSDKVLIEEYIDADAVIIHYTAHKGEIIYSGMADKLSMKIEEGAPIMALQIAPSIHEKKYLDSINEKVIRMFESIGVKEGPLWIESFVKNGRFIFNEMGYRLGGSMTNYLVERLYGINQLDILYNNAIGEEGNSLLLKNQNKEFYCIWPTHLKPGTISKIKGIDKLKKDPNLAALVMVHGVGDKIESWGSAQQVFAYLHFASTSVVDILNSMAKVSNTLFVEDVKGDNLLYSLFNPESSNFPIFLRKRIEGQKGRNNEN